MRIAILPIPLLLGISLHAQPDDTAKFTTKLLQSRYSLSVHNGELSGEGAGVLKSAIAQSRFVLIGETHGLAETASFSAALCKAATPEGFHTVAIEEGPLAAAELRRMAARPEGQEQVAAFLKQYPDSVNIYNAGEEFAFLQQCSPTRLWGVNQEGPGAAGLILQRILDTHPGGESAAAIRALLNKNEEAYAKARQTGRLGDLYMFSAADEELAAAAALLKKDGSPQAQSLLLSLIESHEINRAWPNDGGRRARLMKTLFAADYAEAARAEASPKVLLKFGSFHIYRGLNPMHGSGIGNYVAEFADAHGAQSLHICVMAVKWDALLPRIGQPPRRRTFALKDDPGSRYLAPILANVRESDWTMFDLRPLRQIAIPGSDLATLVFGIDILVMVPEGTPSARIQ